MTHDPQVYPYPDEFIPERFEDHTRNPTGKVQPDPPNLVFGFGRRYSSLLKTNFKFMLY